MSKKKTFLGMEIISDEELEKLGIKIPPSGGGWNHRIVTWKQKNPKYLVASHGLTTRMYTVTEVYYDENGHPWSHIGPKKTGILEWDNHEDLLSTIDYLAQLRASGQPILDLDRKYQEYIP